MKQYAIIGKPVSHSISGQWFSKHFQKMAIDADFRMIEPKDSDILNFREWILNSRFNGLLVTIPFKKTIFAFLDEADEHAKAVGAANVIVVEDGQLKGYNTDCLAFESELRRIRPKGFERAIVLGTGGASDAVTYALAHMGVSYVVVSRKNSSTAISYNDLSEAIMGEADIVINATPLGMMPLLNEYPSINYQWLKSTALAFDLIYNPEKTLFLEKCAEVGCQTANGLGMVESVYRQALSLWNLVSH
ncbi:MAG: shikimate dehydrogenase [Bacteroidales bacterium]|jgi:shikimate dehydrogenase|nr:shikimate dehydrogenase [Bacteroidales bacterium]